MTLKEVYRNFLVKVQAIYPLGEATTITDRVFESTASVKRADIIKTPERLLSAPVIQQLDGQLQQLLQHKPVQYITGETWFYNMKLKVNEHVLIPRPETEELVERVIAECKSRLTDPKILDIGTGSGCIPIALKKHLPAAVITAIDISKEALLLAKENATRHNAAINFMQLDFLDEKKWYNLSLFDIIVSNPPYIPENEKEKMSKNVTAFEPATALFVPENEPLLFYKKIATFGKDHLPYNGRIYMETHEDYAQATADHFSAVGYGQVSIKNDIFGKERIVTAAY